MRASGLDHPSWIHSHGVRWTLKFLLYGPFLADFFSLSPFSAGPYM